MHVSGRKCNKFANDSHYRRGPNSDCYVTFPRFNTGAVYTWYQARSNCWRLGGDLASSRDVLNVRRNSSSPWLQQYGNYSVGLQRDEYVWVDTGGTVISTRVTFSVLSTPLILPLHPLTFPTGSLYHYSIKMCKQVSLHPHPYQKIPNIHLLRSVPLPICTFINFVCFFLSHRIYSMRAIQTFCVHLLLFRYLLLSCSVVLFGLATTRLNKTTITTCLVSK